LGMMLASLSFIACARSSRLDGQKISKHQS
jgi:hypothetical protein